MGSINYIKLFALSTFFLSSAPSIYTATSEKKLRSRDTNPDRLGAERERYHCAIQLASLVLYSNQFVFLKVALQQLPSKAGIYLKHLA